MIRYKERTIDTDPLREYTKLYAVNTSKNWNPPFPDELFVSYVVPSYRRRFERIWWDDGKSWQNGMYLNRSADKPCQHYTCEVTNDSFGTWPRIPWRSAAINGVGHYATGASGGPDRLLPIDHATLRSTWGAFGTTHPGIPSMYVEQPDKSFAPTPTGLTTLVEKSLKATLPTIKQEMSLINSVIELKDLKSLPRTLNNMATLLRKATEHGKTYKELYKMRSTDTYYSLRRTFRKEDGLTLRELFHAPADAHLQAQFGVLPVLRDLAGLYLAITGVGKRINWLVNNQGRAQRRHFTFKWLNRQFTSANLVHPNTLSYNTGQFAGSTTPPGYSGANRSWMDGIKFYREFIVEKPDIFHAIVCYNYYFKQAQLEHAQLYGLYDSLGINLNPAIIWNAIPWTFLVDWVIGVSRWLNDRAVLNMEPGVNISRYLWSWHTARRTRTYYVSTTSGSALKQNIYLPDLYESLYRRDITMPSRTNSLYGSGLSDTELSLGASLAITRAFRPNRRLHVK